jgi:hypothetical protein
LISSCNPTPVALSKKGGGHGCCYHGPKVEAFHNRSLAGPSPSDPPPTTSRLSFMITFSRRFQEGDPGLLDGGNLLWEHLHASTRPASFRDAPLNKGALAHWLPNSSSLAEALKGTMAELVVGEIVRMGATINDAMSRGETIKAFSSEVQRNLSTRSTLASEKLLTGVRRLCTSCQHCLSGSRQTWARASP